MGFDTHAPGADVLEDTVAKDIAPVHPRHPLLPAGIEGAAVTAFVNAGVERVPIKEALATIASHCVGLPPGPSLVPTTKHAVVRSIVHAVVRVVVPDAYETHIFFWSFPMFVPSLSW